MGMRSSVSGKRSGCSATVADAEQPLRFMPRSAEPPRGEIAPSRYAAARRGLSGAGLLEVPVGPGAGDGVDLDQDGDAAALGILLALALDHRRPDLVVDLGRDA